MRKAIVIVGPTGIGKTELALSIAPKINGEIVSADSVQVYKKLDIISGKEIPSNASFHTIKKISSDKFNVGYYLFNHVPIYLLDVVPPTYEFNVSDYIRLAIPTIDHINDKNKLVVLVGGTGYYIKTLIDGSDTLFIPPNQQFRANVNILSVEELRTLLSERNPQRLQHMNESDRKNKRRLIRALEVAMYKEENPKDFKPQKLNNFDALFIGLTVSSEILRMRINKRVEKRLRQGALEEAKELFVQYFELSEQVKRADGYHALFEFLLGKINIETAIENWKTEDYHHAKNQMTWFSKDKRIKWFDIEDSDFSKNVDAYIAKVLS